MSMLHKIAEENKQKEKYVDPYILGSTGLMGVGGYFANKAVDGQAAKTHLHSLSKTEQKELLTDVKDPHKLSKLKEYANLQKPGDAYDKVFDTLKHGDPVKFRNKNALIASGLTAGAIGTLLYGKHQSKKEDPETKYNSHTSAVLPIGVAGGATLGLIGGGFLHTIGGHNYRANKFLAMAAPAAVGGMAYNSLVKERLKNNQYSDPEDIKQKFGKNINQDQK